MRKTLLYIGIAALVLTSCSDDMVETSDFLNGSEKTPLIVSALLDKDSNAKTRAVNKEFEKNDQLIAYLRHVTWDGSTGARTNVEADHAPQLVTFTKGNVAMTAYGGSDITPIGTGVALGLTSSNTQQTTDLTVSPTLYWDDFSNSVDADHDLRTDGHYLESYYGYCYNGGTPTTALDPAAGTLGWTVAPNQTSGFKTSDLLWSYEQTPVAYSHEATRAGLVIPYTHAMSKVTVEVVCGEGFDAEEANFSGASVVLQQMNTVCSLSAPNGRVTATGTPADITMQPIANDNTHQSFSALIAQTTFKDGLELAKINNVDGNNYTLTLTDEAMRTATVDDDDWAGRLTGYTEGTKSGTTQPGVNYLITVTINKQKISVNATIKDWDEVSATGVGVIQFANDITDKAGAIATELQTNGFDLYKAANTDPAVYGVAATTYSYGGEPAKWTRNNEIYWPNATDKFFFRALSGATADDPSTDAENESLTIANNQDVLWGTTSAHKGPEAEAPYSLTYNEGDAIAPRTGDVPLTFYHPMAKITVNLVDENKDKSLPDGVTADPEDFNNPLNPHVNLINVTIQLTNLATGGTISLHDGSITPAEISDGQKTFSEDLGASPKRMGFYAAKENGAATEYDTNFTVKDYSVIPQTIEDNAMLIITLADGTTYRLQLNECVVKDSTTPVEEWVRGKHYTYEITLSKEKITFRALIENWDEVEGGGKATLEWD